MGRCPLATQKRDHTHIAQTGLQQTCRALQNSPCYLSNSQQAPQHHTHGTPPHPTATHAAPHTSSASAAFASSKASCASRSRAARAAARRSISCRWRSFKASCSSSHSRISSSVSTVMHPHKRKVKEPMSGCGCRDGSMYAICVRVHTMHCRHLIYNAVHSGRARHWCKDAKQHTALESQELPFKTGKV